MLYAPNLHYFMNVEDFPFEKALRVTAEAVGGFATHYRAELVAPIDIAVETKREGALPEGREERIALITRTVKWLFDDSANRELFALFLDDRPIGEDPKRIAKFDHHDDTCCWVLNVNAEEFAVLKDVWLSEDLPEDLFTKCDE